MVASNIDSVSPCDTKRMMAPSCASSNACKQEAQTITLSATAANGNNTPPLPSSLTLAELLSPLVQTCSQTLKDTWRQLCIRVSQPGACCRRHSHQVSKYAWHPVHLTVPALPPRAGIDHCAAWCQLLLCFSVSGVSLAWNSARMRLPTMATLSPSPPAASMHTYIHPHQHVVYDSTNRHIL